MNDIQIVAQVRPAEIESNLADLDAAIENQMKAYETLEVTEDNISERKSDVATLRKIKGAIEDRRKEIKRDYDSPLKEFESKVKVVTAKLDKQINRIDGDIKAFDRKRIEEKQAHIQDLYDQNIGEYAEYLPLNIIKSSRWDNKTCTDNEIISDIQTDVMKVRTELDAIRALGSEIEDKLIETYKANGNNLAAAISRNNQHIESKKIAEENLKKEAEAKLTPSLDGLKEELLTQLGAKPRKQGRPRKRVWKKNGGLLPKRHGTTRNRYRRNRSRSLMP